MLKYRNLIYASASLTPTLGTNGGGLATGGHVQTIHGYKQVYYGVGSEQTITLYVNNSWGKNNIAIPYDILVEGDAPSYLKDHVYYTA